MNYEEMMQIIEASWEGYVRMDHEEMMQNINEACAACGIDPLTEEQIQNPLSIYNLLHMEGDENLFLTLCGSHINPNHQQNIQSTIWLLSLLGDNMQYLQDVLESHSQTNELTVLSHIAQHSAEAFYGIMDLFNQEERLELVNLHDIHDTARS